jgi:hypothetical protein
MKPGSLAYVLVAAWGLAGVSPAQDEGFRIFGRVIDAAGAPVAGARVQAAGGGAKTDAAGVFDFAGKPESEDWMLVVRADGHAVFHQDIGPEVARVELVIRLVPGRIAAVRVVGEDGRPVRLATVRGRLPFAPAYSVLERTDFVAQSDQDGIAILRDLPVTGTIVAEVQAPGMIPAQSAPIGPIRPPAAGEIPPSDTIVLTPGRSLRVVVRNPADKPIAGATVNLLPLVEPRLDFGGHAARDMTRGPIRAAQTDASGAASFDLLPASPLACEVRATGWLTRLLVVEAPATKAQPVEVRLYRDENPPPADVPWRRSVQAAAEEAKKTGLPVFLAMSMDGEKANDWMASHHFHDPEIVRAAREVVPLMSNAFGEGGIGESDHREKDGKCTRYGAIPCFAHQQVELLARGAVMQTRMVFEVPRHFATTPSGEKIFERVFYLSERDLLRLIIRALRVAAPEAAVRVARERLAPILEDLLHADAQLRRRAARSLGLLASSGDEHAAALVQSMGALGLKATTRVEVVEEIRPGALTSPEVTFAGILKDPDREVRRAFFSRAHELADVDTMLDRLASALPANDGTAREALLKALDVERKSDELRVRAPATRNRWRVVEELIEIPEAGRVQGLEEIIRDADRGARHRLLRALGRRAAADQAAQDLLVRSTKGPGAVAALRALAPVAAALKPPNAPLRALAEAVNAPDALVREEALRALAACTAPVDLEPLAGALSQPSEAVRIQAALALWRRGDRRGQTVLHAATAHDEFGAEVRAALREGR